MLDIIICMMLRVRIICTVIIKVMKKYLGGRVEFLVFGVSGFFKDYLELLGNVKVFLRLPRKDFLAYLSVL